MIEVLLGSAGIMATIVTASALLSRKIGMIDQHLLSHDGRFDEGNDRMDGIEKKVNGHIHDHLRGLRS